MLQNTNEVISGEGTKSEHIKDEHIKDDDMNVFRYWVHRIPHIGDATIYKLLREFPDEKVIYEACVDEKLQVMDIIMGGKTNESKISDVTKYVHTSDPFNEYAGLIDKGITFTTIYDERYPVRLKDIDRPPYALYSIGKLPENDVPAVAIIGARNCTEYGTFIANAFGSALAKEGVSIISGMAIGVDGIAQRAALNSNGITYAILGSGVDVCYPDANYKLYREIKEKGGVISIFPPGTMPQKRLFPERNRIVAALSDLVLVVEARLKSGTGITVDIALKMGKDVYAVPGRITDRLSDGCNMLLRQGAGIALSPEDILRELSGLWGRNHPESDKLNQNLIPKMDLCRKGRDEGILKYVDVYPKSVDEIHALRLKDEPGVPLPVTLSELVLKCIDGQVVQVGSSYFYKIL